jgi:hypothetical protein
MIREYRLYPMSYFKNVMKQYFIVFGVAIIALAMIGSMAIKDQNAIGEPSKAEPAVIAASDESVYSYGAIMTQLITTQKLCLEHR